MDRWLEKTGWGEVGNGKREKKLKEKNIRFFFEKDVFYAQKVPTPETFLFVIFFFRSVYQPSPVEDSGNFDPKPINDSTVKHPRSFIVGCAWVNEWMHMWRLRCNGPRPPGWMDGWIWVDGRLGSLPKHWWFTVGTHSGNQLT